MIRYLRGAVLEKIRNQIVVDVQGVGYDVYVPAPVLAAVTIGEEVALAVSESIREDGHDLYGFLDRAQRDSFELLRKVSGVGPKVALAITSFYMPHELNQIIAMGDDTRLSLVPGVGKKIASKIVLELKDKVSDAVQSAGAADTDTIDALLALGYSRREVAQAVSKIPSALKTPSERVTWALQQLAN